MDRAWTSTGARATARVVAAATGQLSAPRPWAASQPWGDSRCDDAASRTERDAPRYCGRTLTLSTVVSTPCAASPSRLTDDPGAPHRRRRRARMHALPDL